TCMPCKAFFRRNAVKLGTHEFICSNDGDCMITYKCRRVCNCCRLAKCFRVGMKKSSILSDEQREARNKLIAMNRVKRGQIAKPQWLIRMQSLSLLRIPSSSIQYLSASDQARVTNIFNAYENTCITERNTRFKFYPVIEHKSIHGFLNEISPVFQTFVQYLKLIPEFNNLIINDKIRLMRNHFGIILNINEPYMYSVTPSNLLATYTNVFGFNITKRLLKRNQLIEQFIYDPIILKIVLIILILSSSNHRNINHIDMNLICDDSLSIFRAQNIYVELLWKYILSRAAVEEDVTKLFNILIMCILYVQNVDICIDGYISNFRSEIRQMEPTMQNMWLKTDDEEDNNDIIVDQAITP
ncbi:unnamed protein product, partial [Rotaria sp. Silwood1]